MKRNTLHFHILLLLVACQPNPTPPGTVEDPDPTDEPSAPTATFIRGADLSYVNEMEDCSGIYKDERGNTVDPFALFAEAGNNMVRVRLWHTPNWTHYSTLSDVTETIRRAKAEGMHVLLDFHYSDDWADPQKQEIPAAWASIIDNTPVLADSLYQYTHAVLTQLVNAGLAPDIVQVGNEINPMILQQGELTWPINWERNATLLTEGIRAVREVAQTSGNPMEVMLHIAQPENGLWWFEQATAAGLTDYDWIGLSYYPKWSEYTLANVGEALSTLITTYQKRLMVVETAYPFTLENQDAANNIMGSDALIEGYPATQAGQYQYLMDLEAVIAKAGGEGLVYWEPAWVTNSCSTRWGQGSHWDNATFFDANGQPTQAMQWYAAPQPD